MKKQRNHSQSSGQKLQSDTASGPTGGRSNAEQQEKMKRAAQKTTSLPHQERLEQSFGVDLSHVSLSTGMESQEACASIGARAFVLDGTIFCSQSNPGIDTLAHEVTHIVQQDGEKGSMRQIGSANAHVEKEAHQAAAQVQAGQSVGDLSSDRGSEIRRWELPNFLKSDDRILQEASETVLALHNLISSMDTEDIELPDELEQLFDLYDEMNTYHAHYQQFMDRVEQLQKLHSSVSSADEAWKAYRENSTRRNRERVIRQMGSVLPQVGDLLSELSSNPAIAILQQCDADFLGSVIGGILHTERRVDEMDRERIRVDRQGRQR